MIHFIGKSPSVKISAEIMSDIKLLFSLSKDKMAIFLNIENSGSCYKVKGFYVPKQSIGQTHIIIEQKEMKNIAEDKFFGVCVGGKGTSVDFEKSDFEFFDSTTFGLSKYVGMKVDSNGESSSMVVDGQYRICDIKTLVYVEQSGVKKKEFEAILKDKVSFWTYKDGYTSTVRKQYVVPNIISKNIGWREVV